MGFLESTFLKILYINSFHNYPVFLINCLACFWSYLIIFSPCLLNNLPKYFLEQFLWSRVFVETFTPSSSAFNQNPNWSHTAWSNFSYYGLTTESNPSGWTNNVISRRIAICKSLSDNTYMLLGYKAEIWSHFNTFQRLSNCVDLISKEWRELLHFKVKQDELWTFVKTWRGFSKAFSSVSFLSQKS